MTELCQRVQRTPATAGLTCIKGSFPGRMNDGMPGQLPEYMPLPLEPGNYAGGSRIEETWGGDE
jgi:hypothetical protein